MVYMFIILFLLSFRFLDFSRDLVCVVMTSSVFTCKDFVILSRLLCWQFPPKFMQYTLICTQAALFFGVDKLLVKCRDWLAEVTSYTRSQSPQLFLDDLIGIWNYVFEHGKYLSFSSRDPWQKSIQEVEFSSVIFLPLSRLYYWTRSYTWKWNMLQLMISSYSSV